MSKKLRFQVFTTALVLVCLTATMGFLPGALADIDNISMVAVGGGTYRWLDGS